MRQPPPSSPRWITNVFPNAGALPDVSGGLHAIASHELKLGNTPDPCWRTLTERLRAAFMAGQDGETLLPQAFAVTRAASQAILGLRHFDVQLVCAMLLYHGFAVEMATGEGKTLAATPAAYLNAICGQRTFIVTVNDYLARRDMEWMGPLYRALGLSVGLVTSHHEKQAHLRRFSYDADVVYVTNHELVFDYLRDNMSFQKSAISIDMARIPRVIVDELDLVLLDEARIPFVISGEAADSAFDWNEVQQLLAHAEEGAGKSYNYDPKTRQVDLSESLTARIGRKAREAVEKQERDTRATTGAGDCAKPRAPSQDVPADPVDLVGGAMAEDLEHDKLVAAADATLTQMVRQLLTARHLKNGHDYLVRDGKVLIIDHDSGRAQAGRRWDGGLHEAVETHLGLSRGHPSECKASISHQEFFPMFPRLSGMTGTAWDARAELHETYKMPSAVLATHKPLLRSERRDRHFQYQRQKLSAAAEEIVAIHKTGAPVLVGGPSVEENETLRQELLRRGVAEEHIGFLSAAHDAHEARLIAEAGRPGRITLATNMAGRGTDIILGGNAPRPVAKTGEQAPAHQGTLAEEVRRTGGLHVLLLQRQRSRRRDRQFIGRCARQGDPGVAIAFTSAEDEHLARLGSFDYGPGGELKSHEQDHYDHRVRAQQDENEAIDQRTRTALAAFDGALSHQRRAMYALRKAVLDTRVDWTALPWHASELLVERATQPPEPGQELVDFPLNWIAASVVSRLTGTDLPDPSRPNEFMAYLRRRIPNSEVARRYADSQRAPASEQRSFNATVFDAVCSVVHDSLRPFGPTLAGEFCRIAALSCLDRCWSNLLLLAEQRREDVIFQFLGTRHAAADFARRRFEDFLRHRDEMFDGFLDCLLTGIPSVGPEAAQIWAAPAPGVGPARVQPDEPARPAGRARNLGSRQGGAG